MFSAGGGPAIQFSTPFIAIPSSGVPSPIFVDLLNAQTVAGAKTWSSQAIFTNKVGVGAAPTANETLRVNATTSPAITVDNAGTFAARLGVNSSNQAFVGSSNATPVLVICNGVARITLDTAGAAVVAGAPLQVPSYTVATLPVATTAGRVVYVSDAAVAPCLAFSNGTNWKRCDNAATTVV